MRPRKEHKTPLHFNRSSLTALRHYQKHNPYAEIQFMYDNSDNIIYMINGDDLFTVNEAPPLEYAKQVLKTEIPIIDNEYKEHINKLYLEAFGKFVPTGYEVTIYGNRRQISRKDMTREATYIEYANYETHILKYHERRYRVYIPNFTPCLYSGIDDESPLILKSKDYNFFIPIEKSPLYMINQDKIFESLKIENSLPDSN